MIAPPRVLEEPCASGCFSSLSFIIVITDPTWFELEVHGLSDLRITALREFSFIHSFIQALLFYLFFIHLIIQYLYTVIVYTGVQYVIGQADKQTKAYTKVQRVPFSSSFYCGYFVRNKGNYVLLRLWFGGRFQSHHKVQDPFLLSLLMLSVRFRKLALKLFPCWRLLLDQPSHCSRTRGIRNSDTLGRHLL